MADDGLGPVDLTGRWVGFYRHRSERLGAFPIVAELVQEGGRLRGEMYDQITDRSDFLEMAFEDHWEFVPARDRLRIEETIRRFGVEKIQFESRLPDTSDVDGKVADGLVNFTKSYRGAYSVRWSSEGREIGSATKEGHQVVYSGRLDPGGGCIAGDWTIPSGGWLGRFLPPKGRGAFELYRKP